MPNVTITLSGKRPVRAGFTNPDGTPLGYAIKVGEKWTGYADLTDADGEFVRPFAAVGCVSAEDAAERLAEAQAIVAAGGR